MIIHILTLFPNVFDSIFTSSILKRAQNENLIKIDIINIRDFSHNTNKTVDDKPYGGGKGMVLKVDKVTAALESVKPKPYSILLSVSGFKFTQKKARNLAKKKALAVICGHYEGVDARVENFVDDVISIGDFIMTGGEIAAMAVVDSIARLLPGVIHPQSLKFESFLPNTHLEYPQYTRPENFKGLKVPRVLLSGNHKEIEKWRNTQSLKRTKKFRPDLLKRGK